MPTNQILLQISAWKNRAEKAEKELTEVKAERDKYKRQIMIDEEVWDAAITDANDQRQRLVYAESENRKLKKELEDLKAKPDCTGCIRAKGSEPADVYHGTCFYCCRPNWCNTDHYEAKGKGE